MVEATEIAEKIRSKFDFTVEKLPLSGPDNIRTPLYGLFRSDTMEVIGGKSVTGRYVPHQTDDVLAIVESAATAFGGVAELGCYFADGHYVSIKPLLTLDQRREILANDAVVPRFVLRAGYDGKAFSVSLAAERIICQNLFTMQSVAQLSARIRHTSGLRHKMPELVKTFSSLSEKWDILIAKARQMSQGNVNLMEFVKSVYGNPTDSKRGATVYQNRLEKIIGRINRERLAMGMELAGETVNAWEAFNGIQGYIQHDANRRSWAGDDARDFSGMFDATVAKAELLALSA